MHETGIVTELRGGTAVVQFERKPMCKHCGACIKAGKDQMMVEVKNTLGAQVGDSVAVELQEKSFLTATLILYVIPLLALLAGLGVAMLCGAPDWAQAVAALAAAVLAYVIIHQFEPKFKSSGKYGHRLAEIVHRAGESALEEEA